MSHRYSVKPLDVGGLEKLAPEQCGQEKGRQWNTDSGSDDDVLREYIKIH